jgi:hypothetical protein
VPIRCLVRLLLPRLLFTHHWTKTVTAFTSLHLELTASSGTPFIWNSPPMELTAEVKVKVKGTLRLTVSQSVSLGVEPQIFITRWQSLSRFGEAPSLARGRVRLLYMLLVLVSVVFLVPESFGNRDNILVYQIWNFPFRRLLQFAGSRWRYSTPPPHG